MSQKILAITGPTAVGKTDFFLQLIKDKYPFQAIVTDSRQVYKYLDIGTGKDLPQNPALQKIFQLIDAVTPDQKFSSANFCKLATQAIDDIVSINKQPVLLGGTGRYLKDLEFAPDTLPIPPNFVLRKKLSTYSISALQELLNKKNPTKFASMNHSDINNPRRLIRAIEVSGFKTTDNQEKKYDINIICLTAPLHLIKAKIESRVTKRIEQGMVREVENILRKYPQFTQYQAFNTPGYQEIVEYLNHQISLDNAIKQWTKREIDYAKRQLTWFRHQTNAVWFDITMPNWYADAVKQLGKWGYGRRHT